MTYAQPSILSLSAAALYAAVLAVCLLAALTAKRFNQPPGHWRTWLLIGVFFGLLIVLRAAGTEDMLRDALRAKLRAEGDYDDRRDVQRLIAAVVTVFFAGAFLWWARRHHKAAVGRRNIAQFVAFAAMGIISFLIVLRVVSLHQIDALLYGPMKFNWIIDVGGSLVAAAAAFKYVNLVRARP